MKKISLFLILLSLTSSCFSQQQNQAKQLDSLFSVLYQQNQFSGSVLIADKGKVVFKKGYGYRNEQTKQPNNANTLFELASCSKQFTAAAIVLLKRQGKLRYEDKIAGYFPELHFWNSVTIYDLLRHTSGIPEYLSDMPDDWDKTKIATNDDVINYYAARKDSLQFEPGSIHRYCNTNYVLLASMIERVSGKKYADFLAENIFKPLQMKHTFVYNRRESPRKIQNYATGYVWASNSFKKVTSEHPHYNDSTVYFFDGVVGTAKINTTVEDLYKWILALKNKTLFTQTEFDAMTEVTQTSKGKNIPYGFGLDVSKGENKFAFGHTGSWDGYMTFVYHSVIKDRTIIILQNFKMSTYSFNNISQILDNQPLNAEYKKKVLLPEADIRKYAGVYINKDEQHIITYLDGHLFYNTNKAKWDMRFFPVSATEFQAIRQGGADGLIRFATLPNGDIALEMSERGRVIGSGTKQASPINPG